MAERDYRIERDSMGEVRVPRPHTMARKRSARWRIFRSAVPVFRRRSSIHSAPVKYAPAVANQALGLLDGGIATAIRAAEKQ